MTIAAIWTGLDAILERIDERLDATGLNDRTASIQAFGHPSAIRNIRRGSNPSVETMARLAAALDTTPSYLSFGAHDVTAPPAGPPASTVPHIGLTAAGLWQEVDQAIDVPPPGAGLPPDPAHPAEQQWSTTIMGTSVNRVAPPGSVACCLDLRAARLSAQSGELVIVEQRKDGGQQIMRTAKRFHRYPDRVELWPDSTDPRWSGPTVIRPDPEAEGVEIEVIGRVLYVHAPVEKADATSPQPVLKKPHRGERRAH